MNPQNMEPHIDKRHSSLWRIPMFCQSKEKIAKQLCHTTINQFSKTNKDFWKNRNNTIQTSRNNSKDRMKLLKALQESKNFREINDPKWMQNMINSVTFDQETISKSKQLITIMSNPKLNNTHLIQKGHKTRYPSTQNTKRPYYIYNDYHSSTTNPGFSRNVKGKIFSH